jgi:ATP-binding cassette subfamily B protein
VGSSLTQTFQPLRSISEIIGRLSEHLASAERAFGFLDEMPDVPEHPKARRLQRAKGIIAFRDVSFAYPAGRLALQDASFEVGPGTRAGIMGATGAGKTTLMSLLARFYDPTEGQILLDGVDLRDYRLSDLRGQFAIVLQEPVLFSTTIAENIAYARPGASQDDIVKAAKAANKGRIVTPQRLLESVGVKWNLCRNWTDGFAILDAASPKRIRKCLC